MDEQDYTEATTYFQVGPLDGPYTAADPKFQTLAEAMALELPHKHLSRLDTLGCWQGPGDYLVAVYWQEAWYEVRS